MSSSACRSAGRTTVRSSCWCTGSPTTARVWDHVVDDLERDHRVATYDVRGAGESTAPSSRSGYRMSRLVDDLVAVLDDVAPDGQAVHLVGHDWGSVQLWAAVMREPPTPGCAAGSPRSRRSAARASTVGHFLRDGLRHRRVRRSRASAAATPGTSRCSRCRSCPSWSSNGWAAASGSGWRSSNASSHWDDRTFRADARNGVNLYRANRLSFRRSTTAVPVQLDRAHQGRVLHPGDVRRRSRRSRPTCAGSTSSPSTGSCRRGRRSWRTPCARSSRTSRRRSTSSFTRAGP